jgi:RNA-binding protein 4
VYPKPQRNNVFVAIVGNLPDGYPDASLRELFEQYGEVTECDVLKNFGFVHFKESQEAELAKDGLVNHVIDGKKIRVESSGSGRGGSGASGTKLFVGRSIRYELKLSTRIYRRPNL